MKLLFICSQNKWRSLTAEKMYEGFDGYQVRSAGTEPGARVRVTEGHVGWADLIFVMEKKHLAYLRSKFSDVVGQKQVICLYIPDEYQYMDDELVDLLKLKLADYVDVPE